MPTPCTNCVRFHYGPCHDAPKFCFICGGINHIGRYCPNNKNSIQRVHGEPLAGTRSWQEMHGLQHDPELRHKVLQSLKISPGTAIHVNDVCIYRGYEKHFVKEELRGRTLEARMRQRRRSQSPGRDRLSRSPVQTSRMNNNPPIQGPGNNRRQRSPTPRERRRTPSPYRHASPPSFYPSQQHSQPPFVPRSPHFASGSNAIVFEARRSSGSYQQQPPVSGQGILSKTTGDCDNLGFLPDVSSGQQGLREISGNIQTFETLGKAQQGAGLPATLLAEQTIVEDPHFVLGITKGAAETEIITAYHDRLREVETERAMEFDIDLELNNDYDDSLRLLKASKSQLLGIQSSSTD